MDVIEERLTPAGSKIVRVIAADKILADKIFARILLLLKGANSSNKWCLSTPYQSQVPPNIYLYTVGLIL